MKKNIIFAIKSYNDLDTAASLISHMADRSDTNIFIINHHQRSNPVKYSILDYDLYEYFTDKGVRFLFPDDFTKKNFIATARTYLAGLFQPEKKITNFEIQEFIKKIITKISLTLLPQLDYGRIADNIIKSIDPYVIFVDEASLYNETLPLPDHLCRAAKQHSKKIYGILAGQNVMLGYQPVRNNQQKHRGYEEMLLLPSHLDAQYCIEAGASPETATVIGSLRFHQQWAEKILQILKKYREEEYLNLRKHGKGKTKIVLMLSKLQYGIEESGILELINTLQAMNDVYLIIKPHTRSMTDDVLEKINLRAGTGVLDFDTPSSLLIDWCDACLIYVSSIGAQALATNKLLGYIQYKSRYPSTYSQLGACWTIHTPMDLTKNLHAYIHEKPYTQSHIHNYFREYIYNGHEPYNTAHYAADIILSDEAV